ncbi:MAG TPA: Stk1 family PASTA domain-containing Ser/Thr kinase [Actinotalea sp.]|nr:Stk1 family PASTA domain-containing Ser/Thr kinase [Actinotalea sp.]
MASTLIDPLLGHLIDGRYEVLSRIARGGMATVYLARDRRLDREVALKVMHPHLAEGAAGAEFIARFRREARTAAKLTHPGLVGVYDQGVDGETSYLTMEYIEGTNLRRHLAEHGSLSVARSLEIADAVLDALAAAHRAGLVHRDIKPENVLLAADGRIKVADFGLARAITEVTSTTTGTILGTVAYLAPELVAHGISDTRTDVYSVGILLYEMLTGRQPFTGATPIQIAYQHVHSTVPAPSDILTWLPQEIDELVGALAAREPADRPVDARAALALVRRTTEALDPATLARRADIAPTVLLPVATGEDPPPSDDDIPDDAAPDGGPAGSGHDAVRTPGPATADEETSGAGSGPGPDPDATQTLHVPHQRGSDRPPPPPDDATPGLGSTIALKIGTGLEPEPPTAADAVTAHRRRAWRRVLAVVLTVAVLGGIAWWFQGFGPGAYTVVPEGIVGAELAVAEQALTAAGLTAASEEVFHPTEPFGTVVAATPGEGERVAKEGTVALSVSKGPDLRIVPTGLAGRPVDDVVAELTTAGFAVPEPTHAYADAVAAGAVIGISVAEGAELPVGTEVVVTVSDGPEPLTIISVVGAPEGVAKQQLEDQGLRVERAEEYSEEFEAGVVMAQSPEAGSPGFRTDTVTITISQGPPLVVVPDVVTKDINDARKVLEDAGFDVAVDRLWPWDRVVVEQDPVAGASAPKGTTVTIYAR